MLIGSSFNFIESSSLLVECSDISEYHKDYLEGEHYWWFRHCPTLRLTLAWKIKECWGSFYSKRLKLAESKHSIWSSSLQETTIPPSFCVDCSNRFDSLLMLLGETLPQTSHMLSAKFLIGCLLFFHIAKLWLLDWLAHSWLVQPRTEVWGTFSSWSIETYPRFLSLLLYWCHLMKFSLEGLLPYHYVFHWPISRLILVMIFLG